LTDITNDFYFKLVSKKEFAFILSAAGFLQRLPILLNSPFTLLSIFFHLYHLSSIFSSNLNIHSILLEKEESSKSQQDFYG